MNRPGVCSHCGQPWAMGAAPMSLLAKHDKMASADTGLMRSLARWKKGIEWLRLNTCPLAHKWLVLKRPMTTLAMQQFEPPAPRGHFWDMCDIGTAVNQG
jgi:hypothetical protein